jgi:hypothetical protein
MKNLIKILLAGLLTGCVSRNEANEPTQSNNNLKGQSVIPYANTPRGISVQEIDGCQYIYAETGHGVAIVHKANCNNPTHHD